MTVPKVSVKERVDCNIHLTERRIKGVESCQGPTPGVCFTEVSVERESIVVFCMDKAVNEWRVTQKPGYSSVFYRKTKNPWNRKFVVNIGIQVL